IVSRELIVLGCLYCTLCASPLSSPARNTHTRTQDTLLASSANSTDHVPSHEFHCSFSIERWKIHPDPTASEREFFAQVDSTASFFLSRKKVLRQALTRPVLVDS
ncbi:unnamed protein product, partial [Sphacelaria rigidula]